LGKFSTVKIVTATILFAAGYLAYLNEKPGLRIELEGLYMQKNFRDIGKSLNSCMKAEGLEPAFAEGRLMRANKWFSGWSCEDVGNPDRIVTLNYQPQNRWRYYCRKDDGTKLTGFYANREFELNNIEFIDTWSAVENRQAICQHITHILNSLSQGYSTLFHCEAGRDRTGAMAAIIPTLLYESAGHQVDEKFVNALECDYQKSPSLKEHKYGRIRTFLADTTSEGGTFTDWIREQCDLSPAVLSKAHTHLGLSSSL